MSHFLCSLIFVNYVDADDMFCSFSVVYDSVEHKIVIIQQRSPFVKVRNAKMKCFDII